MSRLLFNICIILLLFSCSSSNEDKNIDNQIKTDVVLYREGMKYLKMREYEKSVEIFSELEIVHPYSSYSTKSQLMAGFAQYLDNKYEEAILTLSKFVELNPDHQSVPYAMYLRAYSYFERIPDVRFEQKISERAHEEFTELVNRFPKSKYAKKSIAHIKTLKNHLAAREVKIGKFYQSQGYYLASIKRYKTVLSEYKRSMHIPESIFRLIECYTFLGLIRQTYYLYRILDYNFPKSQWVKEAKRIVDADDIKKNARKFKKKELDIQNLDIGKFDLI